MSDQLEILEQNGIDKAEVRFQRAVDYAKTLETVQRVIVGVEKALLSSISQNYNVEPAFNVARSLKQAIKEKDTERIAQAEDRLARTGTFDEVRGHNGFDPSVKERHQHTFTCRTA